MVGRRRWWLDPEQVQGHASGAGTAAWASRSRVHVSRVCAGLDKNMAPWGGRGGIELVLNSRVAAVRKGEVDVFSTATGSTEVIPFGACVWSTGVAMHPLVKKLQARRAAAPRGRAAPRAKSTRMCLAAQCVSAHAQRSALALLSPEAAGVPRGRRRAIPAPEAYVPGCPKFQRVRGRDYAPIALLSRAWC